MRKTIHLALAIGAIALAASCSEELDGPVPQTAGSEVKAPMRFSAVNSATSSILDISTSVTTRASLSGSDLRWQNGDKIAIYEYLGADLFQKDICSTTSDTRSGEFTPENNTYNTDWITNAGSDLEKYAFCAYYPESGLKNPVDDAVILTNVSNVQSGTPDGIGPNLICWARDDSRTRADILSGAGYPTLSFSPRMAIININVNNSTDTPLTITELTVTADEGILSGAAELHIPTGALTVINDELYPGSSSISASPSVVAQQAGEVTIPIAVLPNSEISSLSFNMVASSGGHIYSVVIPDAPISNIISGYIYEVDAGITAIHRKASGVTVISPAATLWTGNTATYTASVEYLTGDPEIGDAIWESSDETVATVDPETGVITAVGPGTASIVAKAAYDASIFDSQEVHVNALTGIGITDTFLSIQKSHSATLTASMIINDGAATYGTIPEDVCICWSSEDIQTASLSDEARISGQSVTIYANEAGSTIVTAYMPEGTCGNNPLIESVCAIYVCLTVGDVTMNTPAATLWKGNTTTYSATATYETEVPDQNVTWSSNDESVATVDPATGLVTAVGNCAAVITATSAHDATKTAAQAVYVNTLTDLNISAATRSVRKNETTTLTATPVVNGGGSSYGTVPAITVNWSSSETEKATVSSAAVSSSDEVTISGVSAGSSTITASVNANVNGTHSAVSKTCDLTVTDVSSVAMVTGATTLWRYNSTTFTARITYGSGATSTSASLFNWTSSNPAVASVNSNGVVTANAIGYAYIYATSKEDGARVGSQVVYVQALALSNTTIYVTTMDIFIVGSSAKGVTVNNETSAGTVSTGNGGSATASYKYVTISFAPGTPGWPVLVNYLGQSVTYSGGISVNWSASGGTFLSVASSSVYMYYYSVFGNAGPVVYATIPAGRYGNPSAVTIAWALESSIY